MKGKDEVLGMPISLEEAALLFRRFLEERRTLLVWVCTIPSGMSLVGTCCRVATAGNTVELTTTGEPPALVLQVELAAASWAFGHFGESSEMRSLFPGVEGEREMLVAALAGGAMGCYISPVFSEAEHAERSHQDGC